MEGRVRNRVRWFDDDEDFQIGGGRRGGGRGGARSKPRFSFSEVKVLLEAVVSNRFVLLKRFNQGVSADMKKQAWTEITDQINGLGENQREVRQIMKKWADLKCDGKRRIAALRGPNGSHIRKKTLGPVEKMVHKILMMSPEGDCDSDLDFGDETVPKRQRKRASASPSSLSYLGLADSVPASEAASLDFSPMSSPEKDPSEAFHSSPEFDLADDGDYSMDFDDNDDSLFSSSVPPSSSLDPLPDDALLRVRPVHTYSRNNQSQNSSKAGSSSSSSTSSSAPPAAADTAPPPSQSLPSVSAAVAPSSSSAPPAVTATPSSSPAPPPPPPPPPPPLPPLPPAPPGPSSSPAASSSSSSDAPAPPPAAAALQNVGQMATQSLQQQRASRMLLASVSQSLELLAQSVQLLVESQQEFVQESLLLQRETVDILRDFSGTALAMLRDKGQHHAASRL